MEETSAPTAAHGITAFISLRVSDVSRAVSETETMLEESGASEITRRSFEDKTTFHAFVEAKQLITLLSRLSSLGDVDRKKIDEGSEDRVSLINEITKY